MHLTTPVSHFIAHPFRCCGAGSKAAARRTWGDVVQRRAGFPAVTFWQMIRPMAVHAAAASQQLAIDGAEEIEINVPISHRTDLLRFSNDAKSHAARVVRKLSSLHLNGAGTVAVAVFQADRLELVIAGAGSIELNDIRAEGVELSIAGAGEKSMHQVASTTRHSRRSRGLVRSSPSRVNRHGAEHAGEKARAGVCLTALSPAPPGRHFRLASGVLVCD